MSTSTLHSLNPKSEKSFIYFDSILFYIFIFSGAGRKATKATMVRKGPTNQTPTKIMRFEEPIIDIDGENNPLAASQPSIHQQTTMQSSYQPTSTFSSFGSSFSLGMYDTTQAFINVLSFLRNTFGPFSKMNSIEFLWVSNFPMHLTRKIC